MSHAIYSPEHSREEQKAGENLSSDGHQGSNQLSQCLIIGVGSLARLIFLILPPTSFWIHPLPPHAPQGLSSRLMSPEGIKTITTMRPLHSWSRFSKRKKVKIPVVSTAWSISGSPTVTGVSPMTNSIHLILSRLTSPCPHLSQHIQILTSWHFATHHLIFLSKYSRCYLPKYKGSSLRVGYILLG